MVGLECRRKMKTKINPLMWSKNSCQLALEIDGSTELAIYVKRLGNVVVYTHAGKMLALNLKDIHVKN